MHNATLRRRTLVAAALGGRVVWFRKWPTFFTYQPEAPEHEVLAGLCLQLDCPERIGETCRQALPLAESTRSALMRILITEARAANDGQFPDEDLAPALRRRSGDDFHRGRVVSVNGWVLSLTEARLYALASLILPKHGATG